MRNLSIDTLIGIVGVMATMIGGFAVVARALWRIELKVDTMWEWWVGDGSESHRGGRRNYDPPFPKRGK